MIEPAEFWTGSRMTAATVSGPSLTTMSSISSAQRSVQAGSSEQYGQR